MTVTASIIIAMEGLPKTAFRMAQALAAQPKGGLTPSALFRAVPMRTDDLDHYLDAYPRLFYMDITRIKITGEAIRALERIQKNMDGTGSSLQAVVDRLYSLDKTDIDRLQHMLDGKITVKTKQAFIKLFLEKVYLYPDRVHQWVQSAPFSAAARRIYQVLWEHPEGVMDACRLRKLSGLDEYRAEQTLWELLRNMACFEAFSFNEEDLLQRKIVLLDEIRRFRKPETASSAAEIAGVKRPHQISRCGDQCVTMLARIACAAGQRPLVQNKSGKLSAASLRTISRFCGEVDPVWLHELIWTAVPLGFLTMTESGEIIPGARLSLWDTHTHNEVHIMLARHALGKYQDLSRRLRTLTSVIKPGQWYTLRYLAEAVGDFPDLENPILCYRHKRYQYGEAENPDRIRRLTTLFQEPLHWFGIVDLGRVNNTSLASITEFGYHLISGKVPVSAEHAASPAELIVKPDFEVFVSLREGTPLVLPVLSVYGEVSGEGEHALLFRLTREKYLSALQQGYPDHFLVGFLERHARNNRIPDNVKRTLEDWDRTPRRVRLRRVTLVECDDPVLLAELTSYPELSGRILPTDPKHSLALRGLLSSEAKEILYRKGIIVEQTDPEKPDRI